MQGENGNPVAGGETENRRSAPERRAPNRNRTAIRLMRRVEKDAASGCWLWQGTVHDTGYGYMSVGCQNRRVHRIAYELLVGSIPAGLTIDHLCRNRLCVNPAHLEPVTGAENSRRAMLLPWPRQCVKGHDLERRTGGRQAGRTFCRQCKNVNRRARRAASAA